MLNEDLIIALIDAIEHEGGELVPETHLGMPLRYEIDGKHGRKAVKDTETAGCGAETVVTIPYIPAFFSAGPPPGKGKLNREIFENLNDEQRATKVCLVCDRVDLWPRYANVDPEAVG